MMTKNPLEKLMIQLHRAVTTNITFSADSLAAVGFAATCGKEGWTFRTCWAVAPSFGA